jgi:hypothetical protein
VYFPPGRYLSGTLRLRSHVTLSLDAGAILVASRDDADFDPVESLGHESFADDETSSFHFALLQGNGREHVRILGAGRIDGNCTSRDGPKPIALKERRAVEIRDVTIANAGNYAISLLGCDGVEIVGVTIRNGYSDGIDPDCCQNARIADCRIDSRDDAIALKTSFALGVRRPTRNVTVTGCHLTTIHNALKLGTESTADFEHIVFRDCTIVGRRHAWKGDLSSGLAIETVDGGRLAHVSVSNIRMSNVRAPIFVRLAQRGRGQDVPAAGRLRDVSSSNLVAVGAMTASSITGIPGHLVSEISLRNIRITARGGGDAETVDRPVPELEKRYPDAYMFNDLPAYGLYCRHVDGLKVDGIDLRVDQPDARPALVLDDASRVVIRAMQAVPPTEGGPLVWLRSVRECVLDALRPRAGTKTPAAQRRGHRGDPGGEERPPSAREDRDRRYRGVGDRPAQDRGNAAARVTDSICARCRVRWKRTNASHCSASHGPEIGWGVTTTRGSRPSSRAGRASSSGWLHSRATIQ